MDASRRAALSAVEELARQAALSLGLEIVEFTFHSQGKHSLLRIDIDRPGPEGVGLQDCESLSRALDERLEQLEFFDAPYELQVSSPGIDRPIRSDDDLRRNAGRFVRAEFRGADGRVAEVTGTLGATPPGAPVRIDSEGRVLEIPRDRISLLKQAVAPKGRKAPGR